MMGAIDRARWFESIRRPHTGMAVVLVLAAVLRVGVAIAYRPALFFSDSWSYINLAYSQIPVAFTPSRPSGYPLLIRILTLPARELIIVTTVQHLAGLVTGGLTYALVLHCGTRWWIATLAAAIVLLDSYIIALEQHIMAEAFFALLLLGSVFLAIKWSDRILALAISGALLGVAITFRTAGAFMVPVWLAYLIWKHLNARRLMIAVLCLALPLIGYSALEAIVTKGRGINGMDGWFLYGRIGEISSCDGALIPAATTTLCEPEERNHRTNPSFYVWDHSSPARQMFGTSRHPDSNRLLREFALTIIKDRPMAYMRLVGRDFLGFFSSGTGHDGTLTLPEEGTIARLSPSSERARQLYFPALRLKADAPAKLMYHFNKWIHTNGWLMAALIIAALVALSGELLRPGGFTPHRREIFLLTGAALSIILARWRQWNSGCVS